jgi:hypothetical protein
MRPCAQTSPSIRRDPGCRATLLLLASVLAWAAPVGATTAVYRWVDANGVTHLSSDRPPAGVQYEALKVGTTTVSTTRRTTSTGKGKPGSSATHVAAVSPEQVARRNDAISELRNRECVVALEAIDRLARGGEPVDPTEFRRLQQTADANCSADPAQRRQQEDQAARLRVAKGDACISARNQLAEMLEPGRRPTREQLKSQQEFIEAHCKAPVR